MEKVLLVTVALHSDGKKSLLTNREAELFELAKTAGVIVSDKVIARCLTPTANFYIGKGKVEEIRQICQKYNIATVIFNNELSPTQQRNLEDIIKVKVLDRTQLIMDIFARHAHSQEGKIQVELAQLEYLLPRLSGRGIMLSRLAGGIGTRGPGEQKLEVDRRRIRRRIIKLKKDLVSLSGHRKTTRKKRTDAGIPLVSFVGYTNAGKSTLINALTNAKQIVSDSLFTTLASLSRTLVLPNKQRVILSDTVGFLYRLPHHLIEAFKATLEEIKESDLLIHVIDVSDGEFRQHSHSVYEVLKQLDSADKSIITVLNKIDKLKDRGWLARLKHDFPRSVAISAKNKENLDRLQCLISQCLPQALKKSKLFIPREHLRLIDIIYREGKVETINYKDNGTYIKAYLPQIVVNKIHNILGSDNQI